MPGGPSDPAENSTNEGSAGAGGGSYGGGGASGSNWRGGDDSASGGGGGSWFGGGRGGAPGEEFNDANSPNEYPPGGDGNAAVASPIPDSGHFLNDSNPRLMMGGAGGRGSIDGGSMDGGAGGGIVIVNFATISGPGSIRSLGADGQSPAAYGGGAHSGSGAGGGGQMLVVAGAITSPIAISVRGGVGGTPTANLYHGGLPGGGGGAGGVWLRVKGTPPQCPATSFPNVSFDLSGGSSGSAIVNPKNRVNTGSGGNGTTGFACVADAPHSPTPKFTFVKALGGARAQAGDQFRLEAHQGTLAGTLVGSSTTTGTGATVDPGTGAITVDPATAGTTYVLTEAGASGADLTTYAKTIQCVDTAGVMSAGTGGVTAAPVPFDPATGYAITPVDGSSIACTLTNRPLSAKLEFEKHHVSSTKGAGNVYTVLYDIVVRNTGETTQSYDLTDTLLPGAGAVFQSGAWSGPTSGTISAPRVATTLASGRSIAAGATETYRVTAVYGIDPDAITGSGPGASSKCKPDGTDFPGSYAFHNTASFTWNNTTTNDDGCDEFDPKHGTTFEKVLVSSTKAVDGSYTVIYNIVVRNTGEFTESYDLADTLLPGKGAMFTSGSWTGPTSGAFTAANVKTTLATGRRIAPAAQDTYTVTARYTIDPTIVTGSSPTASNECKPDGTDYTGSYGFHNTAEYTWNSQTTDDDACAPFPFGLTLRKALDGDRWQPGDQFTMEIHEGTLTGPLAGSSTTTGSGATVDPTTGEVTVNPVVSGRTYVLTEVAANGASLADYHANIVCADENHVMSAGQGGITTAAGVPFDPAVGHALIPVAGASITCTLTNRALTSSLDIRKDIVSSQKTSDTTYTVVYAIQVRNKGERPETYDLVEKLLPGSGVTFGTGTWTGHSSGRFAAADTPTRLATNEPIAAGAKHVYTVTVVYNSVPQAILGIGDGASNQCKPDDRTFGDAYGFHNTVELRWRHEVIQDDACAPFGPPPKLALTGANIAVGVIAQAGAGMIAAGLLVFVIYAVRRRRRQQH